MKIVQMGSFFWSVFPVFSLNTGKYGPEKIPYLDTFHAMSSLHFHAPYCNAWWSRHMKIILGFLFPCDYDSTIITGSGLESAFSDIYKVHSFQTLKQNSMEYPSTNCYKKANEKCMSWLSIGNIFCFHVAIFEIPN